MMTIRFKRRKNPQSFILQEGLLTHSDMYFQIQKGIYEKKRIAKIERITSETKIKLELNLDGSGKAMLKLESDFWIICWICGSFTGFFNLKLTRKAILKLMPITQLKIRPRSWNALAERVWGKKRNFRYGFSYYPWMKPLRVALDLSGDLNLSFQEICTGINR
ncbi:MAG: hypothetical protein CM1200mP30_21770 [Pseudomonadota bacterium]|nr:MAG: hypothetical protein CM1200mP30_21770 [Pseudomonadota bacterium]